MRESLDFKNIFKRETKLASYIIICLTVVVISLSYAMFFQVDENTVNQEVVAGDLTFTYSEGNVITSSENSICFEPMTSDEASLFPTTCGYEFSVTNTGTLKASYTLKLLASEENEVDSSKLKIILRKRVGDTYELVESYPKTIDSLTDGILLTNDLNERDTIVYNAQIYVDEKTYTMNDNKKVSYYIEGTGVVHEEQNISTEKVDTTNMMVAVDSNNHMFTQGSKYASTLKNIVFENTKHPYDNAVESVDFSVNRDESVMGYYVANGDNTEHTLYVQANGKIKLNYNASYSFSFLDGTTDGEGDAVTEEPGDELVEEPTETLPEESGVSTEEGSTETLPEEPGGSTEEGSTTEEPTIATYLNINISGLENLDTSNVTDMSHMFEGIHLTSLDLSHFDTSKVTNMMYMFSDMTNLTSLNISSFNTQKVQDFRYMFCNDEQLTTVLYGNHFTYANNALVTSMFKYSNANRPTDSSWSSVSFE